MSFEKTKTTWNKTDKVRFAIMLLGLVLGAYMLCKGIEILYLNYEPIVLIPIILVVYGIAIILKIFRRFDYALKG